MMGGEKVVGTITALIVEKMLTMLGMRLNRKRMVVNQKSQM